MRLLNILILIILTTFTLNCERKNKHSEIRETLEKVLKADQRFRNPYIPAKQNPIDRRNIKIVTQIIDSLGWLGKDEIGNDANLALFLVIQHNDKLSTMEKYLAKMKAAAKINKADKSQVAYLTDRVELINGRKQIYGTQLTFDKNGNAFIDNVIDPGKVNERRKKMGMVAVEEYLKVVDSDSKR